MSDCESVRTEKPRAPLSHLKLGKKFEKPSPDMLAAELKKFDQT